MRQIYRINMQNKPRRSRIVAGILALVLFLPMTQTQAQSSFQSIVYPFNMKEESVSKDMTIAYADEGKGDVILFIHGLGSNAASWKKNISALKGDNRCIVVDLPGYGKSSKGKFSADMAFHANHLFNLMKKLKIKKFSICGHSMGAQIAMHMALMQPEVIQKLILIAPAGIETFSSQDKVFFSYVTPESLASVGGEQYMKNLKANFFNFPSDALYMYDDRMAITNDPQFMDYCHVVVQGIQGMLNQPVFDKLGEIVQPALVIYGKNDALIPNKYLHPALTTDDIAKTAEKSLKNATLRQIDEAGHFVMFEQAVRVNSEIISFLSKPKS